MKVKCPVCVNEVHLALNAQSGDRITCPYCYVEFVLIKDGELFQGKL